MPYRSRWTVPIPDCSLQTFLFTSPDTPLGSKRAFSEAARPDTHYLTRDQFRLWAQRFALGLQRSKHFRKGDRVLLFSGNDLFVPVVFMGVLCAGGIFTGANPTFVARELAHQLKDSGATYLLCSESSLETGIEAAKLAGLDVAERVFVFNAKIYDGETQGQKGCRYWGDLVAPAEEAKSFQWDDLTGPGECDTTLALNYSSGTTGVPKGVEITHKNYISNTIQVQEMGKLLPNHEERTARASWLCFLPLYHAYGQTFYIAGAFNRQIPVYVMPKFDFLQFLEYTQKFRITDYTLVPPIAVLLAKHPAVEKYDLSSVEQIGCGAAPLGRDVSEQVERRLGGRLNFKQGWGMTECTCSLLGWDPNATSLTQAVGEPNANCEAKIMTEDGLAEITERGPDARGELWVRGPNVMKGYWRNPKATQETLTPDGWLKTGDIAYVDDDGKFLIVDRKKELIKVKGNQVAPAELEALLLEHPGIADAAVIGMPTDDGDEKPRAFVVRQVGPEGSKLTEEDVKKFVEGKVVRYKRLAGGVEFLDVIPKNPSGKILRRQLRDVTRERLRKEGARL
ncbi:4-coumarate-CoA ligase [Cladophialophora yegresii CBS 114405]|uniref:4-coumarate-CoA ligase n=1 Tax=Cladophialophora yegresii CBS 114405 TaxID=1182544 RepID=W9W9D0_9EURO|nr:4-coumarate-CoA ligase [Cladophialophora yegresii CBS 114405]EXJ61136.1 4-coumarate-CoA ligase [Cladophialophora yegresii CBS 114405]